MGKNGTTHKKAFFPAKNDDFGKSRGDARDWHWLCFMHGVVITVMAMGDPETSLNNHGARLVPTGSVGRPTVGRPTRWPGVFARRF